MYGSKIFNYNLPQLFVEQTLAIVKPGAVFKSVEIEDTILKSGFTILNKRLVKLSPEHASEFYAHHMKKLYFPSLVDYMSSAPIIVLHLAREHAVEYLRHIVGPINPEKARVVYPDCLRAIYGTDLLKNAIHASQSRALAAREIGFFFNDSIVEPLMSEDEARDYIAREINPTLLQALTELNRQKPCDPVLWLADWLLEHNPNKAKLRDQFGDVIISPP